MLLQGFNKNLNNITFKLMVIVISGLLLISCAVNKKTENFTRPGSHAKHLDPYAFYGEEITPEKEQELLAENVIYFGYDQDDITHRYRLVLLSHAKKMLEDPNLKLRIDGHTDERGSAEYNVGLGERRAKVIVKFIELKGVSSDRLVTVSYGKEKPSMTGHNEEAWRLNRRAELAYE